MTLEPWTHRLLDAAVDDAELLRDMILPGRELPGNAKLGHAGVARPVLGLPSYIEESNPPPTAVHRSHLGFPWGSLLNDLVGDCGPAMAIHAEEALNLDAGNPVPPFGDPQAEKFYEEVGNYDPKQTQPDGSNPTDNGVDNQTLVDRWRNVGILDAKGQRHTIAGSLFIPIDDETINKLAIWEFVILLRAIGLPVSAQGQTHWRVTDPSLQGAAAPDSWGAHDIPYLSYDSSRLRNISWGKELLVDWAFDRAYALQGIVIVTHEMTNRRGVSPSGINWTKLNADLAQFPAVPPS